MPAPKPLVVRAGLSRTFGSMASFAALGLLSLGVYLLADAFAHPVDAEAAGLIVAAFSIAMAMLLFVFVFREQRIPEIFRRKEPERISRQQAASSVWLHGTVRRDRVRSDLHGTVRRERVRSDLPYQRTFVDRSSIRPRTPSPAQARGIAGK